MMLRLPLARRALQAMHSALFTTAASGAMRYNEVSTEDVNHFRKVLDPQRVVTDPDALESYNRDWMRKYEGAATVALKPKTTEEVSKILTYCSMRKLPVVPQGGNTGLVGGSVPINSEVVLSMSNMNDILSLDTVSGALICEAGCILQALDEHVAQNGLTMPLDLGAKGSCQIGGNVSTNAGGIRFLRYGSLHDNVLGMEVVLADGTVLDLLRTLPKDNTGYGLKHLFIGAEGTLGVITKVALQCAPLPSSVNVAFLALDSFPKVLQVLQRARALLGEVLSAYEFLDAESMKMVREYLPEVRDPLGANVHPFYVLVETSGSCSQHDNEKLEAFFEDVLSSGLVKDGMVAQSSAVGRQVWHVREGVTEALSRRGATFKYDLSIPVGEMYTLVEETRARLAAATSTPASSSGLPEGIRVVGYGHVGDGNLHLNVSVPGQQYSEALRQHLEPFVYEWTQGWRGSISAEHGLGRMKAGVLHYSQSALAIETMARLKQMFDPHCILNPHKVLPDAALNRAYGA